MKKYLVSSFLAAFLLVIFVVPSYAVNYEYVYDIIKWGVTPHVVNSGEDEWTTMRDAIYDVWVSSPSMYDNISYDALCAICGDLAGSGYPCAVVHNTDNGMDGYVIRGTGSCSFISGVPIGGRYCSDGTGKVFYAPYNTDSLLAGISTHVPYLDSIYTRLGGLSSYVTEISTRVGGISSYVTAISNKLDTFSTQLGYLDDIYNALNGSHYCLYADADRATIPLSYRTAEQIVAILNTDYVGKKITYFAEGGAMTEYTISHAFIAGGYIKVGVYDSGATTHSIPCLGDDHHYCYSVLPEVSSGGGGLSSEFVQMVSTGFANLSASIDGLDLTIDLGGLNLDFSDSFDDDAIVSKLDEVVQLMTSDTPDQTSLIETYFPDGMHTAGTVSDGFENGCAIQRVGAVDLGTLTWTTGNASGGTIRYIGSSLDSPKLTVASTDVANLTCSAYPTISYYQLYRSNRGICLYNNSAKVNIYDSEFTDLLELQASLSGVMLYYELANPVVTPIDYSQISFLGWLEVMSTQLSNLGTGLNAINTTVNSGVTTVVTSLDDGTDAIVAKLDELAADTETTTEVIIDSGNDAYDVFYVEGGEGEEDQSVVDLSKDGLKVFGKLLDFLYQAMIKDSLSDSADDLSDLADFYLMQGEGVVDVWSAY